jgi:DNA-binding CsgD family transcriptional regulator/tetratricopeptide (TPR) repeat protein
LIGRQDDLEAFTAALDDPRTHGIVIHGPAGVGKTRLGDEFLALAAGRERAVGRATATGAARLVPLGAMAHLLPASVSRPGVNVTTIFGQVSETLRQTARNGPFVLLVDDLPHLDSTSSALLAQVVDAGLLFMVGTVRTGEEVAPELAGLWQRARVRRLDLGDLRRPDVDTLLHRVLPGRVAAQTTEAIWSASRGNLLFIRELVLGALNAGQLLEVRGVWQLQGPLTATDRLAELVEDRLRGVEPEAERALEILAVWEPAGLSVLESIVGVDALDALDRAGLLSLWSDGRRQKVSLAHPLYGEAIRSRIPPLRQRRLLLEYADLIDGWGARRREDPVRVATARLDAVGHADPDLLVAAARLARYAQDYRQVERLAGAATSDGMSADAGLLLGEAMHARGAFTEAESVFGEAQLLPADDHTRALVAEMRARNLMWGLLRYDDALAVNEQARQDLAGSEISDELVVDEALLLTFSGRPLEALAVLDSPTDSGDLRSRVLRAVAEIPALIATGRSETAIEMARTAFRDHLTLHEQIAVSHPGVHVVYEIYALNEAGRIREATALATTAYELTAQSYAADGPMWLAYHLGRAALLSGHAETARRWFAEAAALAQDPTFPALYRLALAGLATAHSWLGQVEAAVSTVAELDAVPPSAFSQSEQELGRAWALVASGDTARARRVLADAARSASSAGYLGAEAWLLHDLARLGDPRSVAARLAELSQACEGELVTTYAAHTAAAAADDPHGLAEVVDRFEAMGADLMAAESATSASHAYQRRGEQRSATALRARASALAGRCEGARVPGLVTADVIVPLTQREREIATLAAQGTPSKEIADRLYVSVRTVNNHLHSAYTKLGVTNRSELARALNAVGSST